MTFGAQDDKVKWQDNRLKGHEAFGRVRLDTHAGIEVQSAIAG